MDTRFTPASALVVFMLALALSGWAQAGELRRELQDRYTRAVAEGKDPSPILARLEALGPEPLAAPAPARPATAKGLDEALAVLRAAADAALAAGLRGRAVQQRLLAAYEGALAARLLMDAHLAGVREALQQRGASAALLNRQGGAERQFGAAADAILSGLEGTLGRARGLAEPAALFARPDVRAALAPALAQSLRALDAYRWHPPRTILRAATLPYRAAKLAPRAPQRTPAMVPSYTQKEALPPVGEDWAATPEAPLSEAIAAQAEALEHDAIRIYEFVHNRIRTQWYAGSMKGAEQTLREGAGNDIDQASLLIALYRASGLPARYVHGVVELPVEAVMASLGLSDPNRAVQALRRAGVAFEPQIRGGRLAAVHIEQTWVSARIPYANYRGAIVDGSGPLWLPLAPALKGYAVKAPAFDLKAMGFTAEPFISEYLSAEQPQDPLGVIRQRITAQLLAPGERYADGLGAIAPKPEAIGLLPNTLPVPVVAVTGEAASLSSGQRQRLRLVLYRGTAATAPVILDHTLAVSAVAGHRLTLSYLPATVDDQKTINAFGGLAYVPPYLVQLRPQIKLDGRRIAVAEAVPMGRPHRLAIRLLSPAGEQTLETTALAGSYQAIGVNAGQGGAEASGAEALAAITTGESDPADTEYLAARLLDGVVKRYGAQWTGAEAELAELMNVALIRPFPAVAVVGNVYTVDWLLGQPHQMHWSGVAIDAALRVAEALSRADDPEAPRQWMRLSALQGSSLEHRIFEDLFQVQSISADKGLQLARAAGVAIVRIDSANAATRLPTLEHPAQVLADVGKWVEAGMAVRLPVREITHEAWTGSVWVVEAADGAGGYFIAGGLAGGQSTSPGPGWTLQWLRDILNVPYSPPANPDPDSGVSVTVVEASNGQDGVVGKAVARPLAAIVRDAKGGPVVGAAVTFIATRGQGTFLVPVEETGSTGIVRTVIKKVAGSVTVTTDAGGQATVGYRLGESTGDNPVFVYRRPKDEHVTRASLNVIDVAAQGRAGTFLAPKPLQLMAYPDKPVAMGRTNTCCLGAPLPDSAVDHVNLRVTDPYDNPVSNVDISFRLEQSGPRPEGGSSGRLFIGDAEVALPFTDVKTGPRGAGVVLVLGSGFVQYTLKAQALGTLTHEENYTLDLPDCTSMATGMMQLRNEFGQNIAAARVNSTFHTYVGTRFRCWDPVENAWYPADVERVDVDVDNGGSALPPVHIGDWWMTHVNVGSAPGENHVSMTGQWVGCAQWTEPTSRCYGKGLPEHRSVSVASIIGVDPQIIAFEAGGEVFDPKHPAKRIPLTGEGTTAGPVKIHYITRPLNYNSLSTELELIKDGVVVGTLTGSKRYGPGEVTLPRTDVFDIESDYYARLVLNKDTQAEVRSDRVYLPLTQPIFKDVSDFVNVSQDVDLLNQRACAMEEQFEFTTTQPAEITLTFFDAANPAYKKVLIDGKRYEAGEHEFPISVSELPPGEYRFELNGVSGIDGHEDTSVGGAHSSFSLKQVMPVGHTLVQGVDVNDGALALSRSDIDPIAGRGTDLAFRRTYSSNDAGLPGGLGAGWSHNLGSKIVMTPCGEIIVIGGQGGGMRFVEDAQGNLTPLRGYHGTLMANQDDKTFDFYAKDGTRYHYQRQVEDRPVWSLLFSEDTNGNRTSYRYTVIEKEAKVSDVTDAAGRSIRLHRAPRVLEYLAPKKLWFITALDGPDGIHIDFEQDEFGNLISATRVNRDGEAKTETYRYANDPALPFSTRHKLLEVTDPIGGRTGYTYSRAQWSVQGNAVTFKLPMSQVESIDGPEGHDWGFSYTPPSQPAPRTTGVSDPRGYTTRYTQNAYGSTVAIDGPAGTTRMDWDIDKVQLNSRKDAKDVTTFYTYNDDGEILSERTGQYQIERTYKVFRDKPWIKNRVDTEADRNGHTTRYDYDDNGNLVFAQDPEGNATYHTYADNGDRMSTLDPRGNFTRYTYDAYGNVASIRRPLDADTDNVVSFEWDARSRKTAKVDARQVRTDYVYNDLDQLTTETGPTGTRKFTYDHNGNKLTETDQEDHTTTYKYDTAGQLIRIVNALTKVKRFDYDDAGNKNLETDWRGNPTTFVYDPANRLKEKREPLNRTTKYEHDNNGNLAKETDALGHSTTYEYDALNRRTDIYDALEHHTQIVYDGENKIAEIDPLLHRTDYIYYDNNRLKEKREPLQRTTTYRYDGNGNKVAETDANHHTRSYQYDALNRLISRTDAENNTWTFEYDGNGNKTAEIDPRLSATRYKYDKANRLKKVTDPEGYVTEYDYDAVGNRKEERHPDGRVVKHVYDDLNRLEETSDNLGLVAGYTYDADGRKKTETDGEGHVTIHEYDELGQLRSSLLPQGHTFEYDFDSGALREYDYARSLKYDYDLVGNRTHVTDARGHTTVIDYDELNRPETVTDPQTYTVVTTYDALGNKETVTDQRDHTTKWKYDALNRPVKVTDPLGQTVKTTYDPVGNVLTETDKRGTVTVYTYDNENRRTTVTKAGIRILKTEYDAVGNKAFETDAQGNITAYLYDKRNLLKTESRPLAAVTGYHYDPMGRRDEVRDPEGRTTGWKYDVRGRVRFETNPAGEVTETTWDGNGHRTSQIRPEGNTWRYAYDDAGRLIKITDPLGGVTKYGWDGNGNRTGVADAKGQVTTYEYDPLNRKTLTRYHEGAAEHYGYDGAGNRDSFIDAKGQAFSYAFDALNRQVLASYPAPALTAGGYLTAIATEEYDGNNNPKRIAERWSDGRTRVTVKNYDAFDRLSDVTDADGKALHYDYDKNGNRTALTDPDGRVSRYAFDALNRLTAVTTQTGITEYAYDRSGLKRSVRYPNGTTVGYTYDPAGRLKSLENRQGSTVISRYDYQLDLNGNRRVQVEENGGEAETTTYQYDDNDRLTEVNYDVQGCTSAAGAGCAGAAPDKTVTYTYDAAYNRTGEKTVDTEGQVLSDKTYTYNTRNQLTGIADSADPEGAVTYQYDANGNRTVKSKNGTVTTFIYDVRDQLTTVRQDATTLGAFRYDYRGLRIGKRGEEGERKYIYDGDSVLLQTDAEGHSLAKYDYGPDQLLSLTHKTEGRQFYHFDGLGSVANLTNGEGGLQARYQYDAWGNIRQEAGASANIFGFTGHERDRETGLYYFKARFYDPDTGRFLSQDSYLGEIDTAPSLHRYLYAYSNPTVYWDRTGHAPIDVAEGFVETALNTAEQLGSATPLGGLARIAQTVKLRIEDPEKYAALSREGGILVDRAHHVDLREGTVQSEYVPSSTMAEQVKSTVTLGLVDAGKTIGNGAGAISVSLGGDVAPEVKDQADRDSGGAAFNFTVGTATYAATRRLGVGRSGGRTRAPNEAEINFEQGGLDAEPQPALSGPTKSTDKTPPDFIVTRNGTAVHASQSKLKESITDAGATSRGPTTNTTEVGEIFQMDTAKGPMEIRVMEGKTDGGMHQDARTVVTRPGTKEYVHADGSRIEGAVSKTDRKAIGHIHGQVP